MSKTQTIADVKHKSLPRGTLSTAEVCSMFGVKHMTIFNWRRGSIRRTPLPFHTIQRGKERTLVFFKLAEVKAWAKQNQLLDQLKVK